MAQERKLRVKLVKSLLGRPETQRRVARALGLKRTQDEVVHYGTDTILGMVRKISHLLVVTEEQAEIA